MARMTFASGLSRGWTPQLTSNRIAMAGWVVSLVVFAVYAATADSLTYVGAASSSIIVFVGWAIGRELDPDRHIVGTLAMIGTFVCVFVQVPEGWTVGAALLTLRIITGPTGRWLALFDLLFAVVIGFGSGMHLWSWPIAVLALIGLKVFPEFGRHRWAFMGTVAIAFVVAWYLGDLTPITIGSEQLLLAAGVVVATGVASISVHVTVETDRGKGSIQTHRVLLSRIAAGLIAIAAVLVGDTSAFWSIGAVTSGLVAVGLVTALAPLFRSRRAN